MPLYPDEMPVEEVELPVPTMPSTATPVPTPARRRTAKPAEKKDAFPETVLLDTETGKFKYLTAQPELDGIAAMVRDNGDRYRVLQGKHVKPSVEVSWA